MMNVLALDANERKLYFSEHIFLGIDVQRLFHLSEIIKTKDTRLG